MDAFSNSSSGAMIQKVRKIKIISEVIDETTLCIFEGNIETKNSTFVNMFFLIAGAAATSTVKTRSSSGSSVDQDKGDFRIYR